jgi:MFS family permease
LTNDSTKASTNDEGPEKHPSPDESSPPVAHGPARLLPDVTLLRTSRDFRLVWTAGLIGMLGSAFPLLVAVPLQVMRITGSTVAVGLIGVAELIPMLLFGLYGGALADAVDRRRLVLLTEVGLALITAGMLANALLDRPLLWPLYVGAAATAALQALQWPAAGAMVPQLVPHEQLPAAASLGSLSGNLAVVVGPALGGVVAATAGLPAAYLIGLATFGGSIVLLSRVRPLPARAESEPASLRGIGEGLRYVGARPALLGTNLVDMVVTVFAVPTALFAFLADDLHAMWALGLLYAAPAAGSIAAGATSGWLGRVDRLGRVVVLASAVSAAAILGAGPAGTIGLVLPLLVLAGAGNCLADAASSVIWNQSVPDRIRGRLAGIELLAGELGPTLGQARSGLVAARLGVRAAVWTGGLAALGGAGVLAGALPGLWRYDARTDPDAVAAKRERAALPID